MSQGVQQANEEGLQSTIGRDVSVPNQRIVDAMNTWSGGFFKLTLPSGLGTKATIKETADEGAKVLSMGTYLGHRTAVVAAVPYDGSRYEGHTMQDESKGTLWMYETDLPDGFSPRAGEQFLVSLGKTFKCPNCRGQGLVTCRTCNGRVRWTTRSGDTTTEHTCNCGNGKENCGNCSGYGEMLQVLRVATTYTFDEKKDKEYSGRLPESLLMTSPGNAIFRHTCEFEKRAIAEAIDGFEPEEFDRLMKDTHQELKAEATAKVAGQMVNPTILHSLIDDYFKGIPNPVAANKRLQAEVLPVRMKCEVTDVPVQSVKYEYKGKDYALYVYGNGAAVWIDGDKPSEFTWKLGVILGLVGAIVLIIIIMAIAGSFS
jgi:hypothetical protein